MRSLNLILAGALVGVLFFVYDMKHATRRLEARAAELARLIAEERDDLAVMSAEWGHVSRPDRVEALARSILAMEPIAPARTIDRDMFVGRETVASIAAPASPADAIAGLLGGDRHAR